MTDAASELSLAERVDADCDRFERAFRSGNSPAIEDYLDAAMPAVRTALFRSLLGLEWELRQQRGDSPNAKEYEARFPDYRKDIREIAAAGPSARSVLSSVKVASAETSKGPAAARPIKATDSQVVNSLGRFEILSVLGEGAFGTVYRAHDPQLDRDVAIKVPRFGAMQSADDRERFLREARAAASLHHAQICPVHEVGTLDNRDYIVMAFIDGKPLSKVIQTQNKLNDKQIVSVVRKLALALQEAHDKGIIHRDLKPANIMINRKGEPVIMDFGLARRDNSGDAQISQSGQILGTPAYMSPEQARGDGKAVGPAADIYSLGIVFYELLCGHRPFEGTITEVIGQILHVPAEPPSAHRPDVDPRLEQICLKAIAKKPADRYASMKDFAAALAEFLKDPTAAADTKSPSSTGILTSVSTDRQKLAQQFIKQGQLPAALEALEPLLSSPDKSQADWARQQAAKLNAEIEKWEEQAPSLIALSHKLMRKHDYTEARKLLLQVPVSLRNDEMQEILRDAEDKEEECDLLLMEIETALKKEHAKELPSLVKRFLQLKPGHKEMQKLAADLKQYGAERAIKIRKGHRSFDAAGAISNWKIIAAIVCGFAALFAGVCFAVTIFLQTAHGTLIVTVENPAIVVSINGEAATFEDQGKKITLKPTEKGTLSLSVDGTEIDTGNTEITVKKKETKQLTARLLPNSKVELSIDGVPQVFSVPGKAPAENVAASDDMRFSTSARRVEVKELNLTGYDTFPWISTDGKRIYFESKKPDNEQEEQPWVWVAERTDANSPFGNKRPLFPGRHPALTGDELEIVFVRGKPGAASLRSAKRNSISEPFVLGGEIPELKDQTNPKSPFLLEGGWILMFQRGRGPDKNVEFVFCAREDRNSPWSEPQLVRMTPDPTWTEPLTWPAGSADGLTLWYCHGGGKTPDIRTATRPDWKTPFDNHQPVIVEGAPLIGRSPRYVAATNELFYSANVSEQKDDWSLWVVKDYQPPVPATAAPPTATPLADGWIELFNGKDLTGWKTHPSQPGGWTVENGLLTGRSDQQHHLFTERGDFENFHLRAEVKINHLGNSGIWFRSPFNLDRPVGQDLRGTAPFGYHAMILEDFPRRQAGLTGTLRRDTENLRAVTEPLIQPDQWFTLEIRAEGKHLTVKVDGMITAEVDDPTYSRGHLVLKARGEKETGIPALIQFRKIAIKELPPKSDGWIELFDGKDLANWISVDGKPATWKVENGYMEVSPKSNSILTRENFPLDLELHVEFWLPKEPNKSDQGRANSGVYLHGRHEIQICDGFQNPISKPLTACGALYGEIAPSKNACTAPETWQTFDITYHSPRVDGQKKVTTKGRLTVIHNGTNIIDNAAFEKIGGLSQNENLGQPGPILLQDHGSPVRFRNIRIRPLNATAAVGWQPLFTSDDLTAWQGRKEVWTLQNGVLTGKPATVPANTFLFSPKEYRDFELRFQVRAPGDKINSGVNIRSEILDPQKWSARGPQCDIGNRTGDFWGGVYGEQLPGNWLLKPAKPAAVNRDDFNDYFIRCVGNHVTIQVNGETTVDGDVPGMAAEGLLGFQIHRGNQADVTFRNIEIRELGEGPPQASLIPPDAQFFNGHSYKFYAEQLPWKDAKAKCETPAGI